VSRRLRGRSAADSAAPVRAVPQPKPTPKTPADSPTVFEPSTVQAPTPRPARTELEVELELSDEDLELFPSLRQGDAPAAAPPPVIAEVAEEPGAAGEPLSPEDRLAQASAALEAAEMRDDIADSLLRFCSAYLSRRMLLAVRSDAAIGWRGEGEGVDPTAVRAISIPLGEPSVLVGLAQGQSFWLGSLPPMPRNIELIKGLGGGQPKDCVILPITMKSKTVCFLYGDNLSAGVAGLPVALLRRLAAKASLAFQVYLLRGKIRML